MQSKKITTSVLWTDKINSTPIDDLRYCQMFSGDKVNWFADTFKMNKNTLSTIGSSKQAQNYISKSKLDEKYFLKLMWGQPECFINKYYEPSKVCMKPTRCILEEQIPDGEVIIQAGDLYKISYKGF